jgi:hypothetical protein
MVIRFYRFLFGNVPVEIPSAFSLQDSVDRLSKATKRSILSALFRQAVVGRVTASEVRFRRVIPLVGNAFKPFFVGRFQESDGHVVLRGTFTMSLFAKVFMSVWLGLALFELVLDCLDIFWASGARTLRSIEILPAAYILPVIGAGFLLFGILLVRFGWWLSRGDMKYMTTVMNQALQAQPLGPPGVPLTPGR